MDNKKKIILASISVPVLIIGWAAFRPELLFVNQTVNEKAPSSTSGEAKVLASGNFTSYAHETHGSAEVLATGDKKILRLSNFKTSNGPDVHVYLVKGTDSSGKGVNDNGFLDLGSIKGNQGDQNYDLPDSFDLKTYQAVSIWCKRFAVGFAGATLASKTAMIDVRSDYRLAGYYSEIRVTSDSLSGKAKGFAELVESSGKRFVRIKGLKVPTGKFNVLLVKAEEATSDAVIKSSEKIVLGVAKNGTVQFPITDAVDAWLFRTVSIWDTKSGKSIATAHLKSDQERKKSVSLL